MKPYNICQLYANFMPTYANWFSNSIKHVDIICKNKEIGRADELGSGVRNLFKYSKHYSVTAPQLIEGDIFKFIIHLDEQVLKQESEQVGEQVSGQVSEQVRKFLDYCRVPKKKQEILKHIGLSEVYRNYRNHIFPLIKKGLLELTIPEKPNSSNQKYRITPGGQTTLDN